MNEGLTVLSSEWFVGGGSLAIGVEQDFCTAFVHRINFTV